MTANRQTVDDLPEELPVEALGKMEVHFNYGNGQGGATYSVWTTGGQRLPIGYQYDTRRKDAAPTGFFFLDDPESEVMPTWRAVRAAWPAYRERLLNRAGRPTSPPQAQQHQPGKDNL